MPEAHADVFTQYQVNAFTLDSPDLSPLGVTVNPALGMANHSCDPNAVVVFPDGGGVGRLMAIRHIAADEEVRVYIVLQPRFVPDLRQGSMMLTDHRY